MCCATQSLGTTPTYTCRPSTTSACAGTPIFCDDQADCGGQICCGQFNATLGYRIVTCMTTCTGELDGNQLIRFCNPKVLPDECAALGKTCQPSTGLVGFYRCQ
jgi:hypothetical protein